MTCVDPPVCIATMIDAMMRRIRGKNQRRVQQRRQAAAVLGSDTVPDRHKKQDSLK